MALNLISGEVGSLPVALKVVENEFFSEISRHDVDLAGNRLSGRKWC